MTRRLVASTPGETDGQQCFLVVLFYFSLKKKVCGEQRRLLADIAGEEQI